jgi:hypothetical protein
MSEAQDLIGFTGGGGENQVWPMLRILKYFLKIGNDFSHFYKKIYQFKQNHNNYTAVKNCHSYLPPNRVGLTYVEAICVYIVT